MSCGNRHNPLLRSRTSRSADLLAKADYHICSLCSSEQIEANQANDLDLVVVDDASNLELHLCMHPSGASNTAFGPNLTQVGIMSPSCSDKWQ